MEWETVYRRREKAEDGKWKAEIIVSPSILGEWIAMGIPGRSSLLVWEWQSERYVLNQQGHFFDINCLAYGPQGRYLASGTFGNIPIPFLFLLYSLWSSR
jgi:hypothetical protein